ncbi:MULTISPECIES: hypothetical protein [Flavobacterium]|uniref:Spo0E like sporulation regulatory protein n=1 Tax=Flavobacterium jumunjinense TaxID=998845 RepID=A0ABV5GIH3_9FLAO|nr:MULTISPECIES: hypothetical protein [Flavobacterium]
MTEEQAEKMIELLEDMSSKLEDIRSNTNELTNLSIDMFVLDKIYELLKKRD